MNIEINDKTIKMGAGAIGTAFAVYLFFNSIYIENHEMELEKQDITHRLLMSESTRYAQISKYYKDLQAERPLTKAEESRLELVQREQCRIRNIIAPNSEICDAL